MTSESAVRRTDLVAMGILFALAAAIRLSLREHVFFSDEALNFWAASQFWGPPDNLRNIDGSDWTFPFPPSHGWGYHHAWWFLERPGYYLLLSPGAWISFDAFRLETILLSSFLPLALVFLCLNWGVARPLAYAGGLTVALHPLFVVWGAVGHMDSPMTLALALAVAADQRGRPVLAAGLSLWAVWMKEVAVVVLGMLLLLAAYDGWKKGTVRIWPLQLDARTTPFLAALALAFIPVLFSMEFGLTGLPGQDGERATDLVLDHAFLSFWFLPVLLVGVLWARTRRASLVALAFGSFFFLLNLVLGRTVREWYVLGPALFSLAAILLVLDEGVRRAWRGRNRMQLALPALTALALAAILGTHVLAGAADGERLLNPVSGAREDSLTEAIQAWQTHDPTIREILAKIRDRHPTLLVAVDMPPPLLFHPLPTFTTELREGNTNLLYGDGPSPFVWANTIEQEADLVVVHKRGGPGNEAILAAYRDCVEFESMYFTLIDGKACIGRERQLRDELRQRWEVAPV